MTLDLGPLPPTTSYRLAAIAKVPKPSHYIWGCSATTPVVECM